MLAISSAFTIAALMYAALDLTPFAAVAAALLSGGIVQAINQGRKTPAEVESISVATLSGALQSARAELLRKDEIITAQGERIAKLEAACRKSGMEL